MNKIDLIMPMAGGGVRFRNNNFLMPKPLIEIFGKPFFYWSAMSALRCVKVNRLIFVVLAEHEENFGISAEIRRYFPDSRIVVLPEVTRGAVITSLEGVKLAEDGVPVVFNDCDHIFASSAFGEACSSDPDGMLMTFKSDEDKFSYIRYDQDGSFCGTVEKSVVSNDAICGVYYFRNKEIFTKAAERYLNECSYSEFFMSGVYNSLHGMGGKIVNAPVDFHLSFGTPDEYDQAQKHCSLFEALER